MTTYKNRHGDVYTFTKNENHDILWEGSFDYCRIGYPNDYTKAYNAYVSDGGKFSFNEFKDSVHEWDDDKRDYVLGVKYISMVESLRNKIDMVDPSGGPYISAGMSLSSFGFKNYVVKDFEYIDTGYKIIVEKCAYCHQAGAIHKMGCETRKIQINL